MAYTLFSLASQVRSFTRVVVPGEVEVTLNAPTTYTVFFEPVSKHKGTTYRASTLEPDPKCELVTPDGKVLSMMAYTGETEYNIPAFSGRSIGCFSIGRPGRYTLRAAAGNGRVLSPYTVAIGVNPIRDLSAIAPMIAGPCVAGLLLFLGCMISGIRILRYSELRSSRAYVRSQ